MDRVDHTRISRAADTVAFVAGRVDDDGAFRPPEALFPETTGYQAELAGTMAVAGRVLGMPEALETAKRMFHRILGRRIQDGLWSLDWWKDFPTREPLPADWEEQNQVPDARYTAAALFSLGLYHQASGDHSFIEPAKESMRAMFRYWDFMGREYPHLTREMAALAAVAWQHVMPEFMGDVEPILAWVSDTFVELAPQDFPFFTALRTMLLLAAPGTDSLGSVIVPAIDALLGASRWRFEQSPNHFRHIESTDDHINTRGNTALALTFRLVDLAAGEARYTETDLYTSLSGWIDGMRGPEGGYYECQDLETGRRWGQGSPAHYLPIWWTLGGLET